MLNVQPWAYTRDLHVITSLFLSPAPPTEANCTYFKFFTTGENAHIFQRTTKKGKNISPGRGDGMTTPKEFFLFKLTEFVYNTVLVSGVQQNDSIIFSDDIPLFISRYWLYFSMLDNKSLLVIYFMYSSLYLLVPKEFLIASCSSLLCCRIGTSS